MGGSSKICSLYVSYWFLLVNIMTDSYQEKCVGSIFVESSFALKKHAEYAIIQDSRSDFLWWHQDLVERVFNLFNQNQ